MRLLCATDLLRKSESAIDRAGLLAEQLGAELSLLHVTPPTESDSLLEQDLQRASERLTSRSQPPSWRFGPAPTVLVRAGHPVPVLTRTAEELDADLLVLGAHRKRAVRAVAGTIAERMLSQRRCPVLIVQHGVLGAYRNVLSVATVRAAEALVLGEDVRASVVHAYEPPYQGMLDSAGVPVGSIRAYSRGWTDDASETIRALLKRSSQDFQRYNVIMKDVPAVAAIRNTVRHVRPDLLVLGTRGHGWVRRALMGSVANRVLATATTDVLIVPNAGGRHATHRQQTRPLPDHRFGRRDWQHQRRVLRR
jgi:universal stress protein E